MGSDDLFKKKRAMLQERRKDFLDPKPNSFLIVTEGTKTEPLYFEGLAQYIKEKFGGNINVEKPLISTSGEGKCTVSLVEAAAKTVSRAPIIYSQIWVVFDKDDFSDFDDAVILAERYGFRAAWSNQSFEYWLYLHFYYSDAALHRDDWVKKLDDIFRERDIDSSGFSKSNPDLFKIATTYGSLKYAVNCAVRVEKNQEVKVKPSQKDPCTMVHHLILELKPYILDLLS